MRFGVWCLVFVCYVLNAGFVFLCIFGFECVFVFVRFVVFFVYGHCVLCLWCFVLGALCVSVCAWLWVFGSVAMSFVCVVVRWVLNCVHCVL